MTTPLRRGGGLSMVLNAVLFLLFFDVMVHQVVARVLAIDAPVHRWYVTTALVPFAGPAAGPWITPGLGADVPAWYAVYWDASWLARASWRRMVLADWTFAVQTLAMCAVLLLRRRHVSLDRNLWHQAVALFAFGSGVFFIGEPLTADGMVLFLSQGVVVAANLLGVATLVNLGRSFGILIALRRVESRGLYGIVRHPMYASDILLKAGFLAGHLTRVSVALFIASTAAYVYRAILEERFLSQAAAYREYQQNVRFRFVPGIF
jgi:protein-S-isoprenylcysteine O-methyltransferase Ste14